MNKTKPRAIIEGKCKCFCHKPPYNASACESKDYKCTCAIQEAKPRVEEKKCSNCNKGLHTKCINIFECPCTCITELKPNQQSNNTSDWEKEFKDELIGVIRSRPTSAGEQGVINYFTGYIHKLLLQQERRLRAELVADYIKEFHKVFKDNVKFQDYGSFVNMPKLEEFVEKSLLQARQEGYKEAVGDCKNLLDEYNDMDDDSIMNLIESSQS